MDLFLVFLAAFVGGVVGYMVTALLFWRLLASRAATTRALNYALVEVADASFDAVLAAQLGKLTREDTQRIDEARAARNLVLDRSISTGAA